MKRIIVMALMVTACVRSSPPAMHTQAPPAALPMVHPSFREETIATFLDGQEAYDAGNFDAAIRIWMENWLEDPQPTTLYNLAQAYRRLGQFRKAEWLYQAFCKRVAPSIYRTKADRWAVKLASLAATHQEVYELQFLQAVVNRDGKGAKQP